MRFGSRTRRQPAKRFRLPKNEFVLLPLFFQSSPKHNLHLPCFQAPAYCPQPYATTIGQVRLANAVKSRCRCGFWSSHNVKNRSRASVHEGFHSNGICPSLLCNRLQRVLGGMNHIARKTTLISHMQPRRLRRIGDPIALCLMRSTVSHRCDSVTPPGRYRLQEWGAHEHSI